MVAGLCAGSTAANAQPSAQPTHLDWQTPPGAGCIPQRQLEKDVEALLGGRVFVPLREAQRVVSGVMMRRDERWHVRLGLATAAGESLGARELSAAGPACAGINPALIVVLATLIDTPARPSEERAALAGVDLGLGLGVRSATLPRAAVGATLSLAIVPSASWPALRLALSGWLPEQLRTADGVGASFRAGLAGFSVCPQIVGGAMLRLDACAGVELGVIQGSGLGLAPGRTPSRLLLGLPVETGLSFQVFRHLAVRLSALVALALERPRFYFEAADGTQHGVHRVGALAAALRLSFIATRL